MPQDEQEIEAVKNEASVPVSESTQAPKDVAADADVDVQSKDYRVYVTSM
jgi:hypothetical protein